MQGGQKQTWFPILASFRLIQNDEFWYFSDIMLQISFPLPLPTIDSNHAAAMLELKHGLGSCVLKLPTPTTTLWI